MNEVKKNSSPWAQCIILCCRTGPIFIRASYGTSHGQNNISMVVTRTWRQDESRIKIKTNEYKWCLLHLEEGINHTWANVFSLPLSFTFSHHTLMLSFSLLFVFRLTSSDWVSYKVSFCINNLLREVRENSSGIFCVQAWEMPLWRNSQGLVIFNYVSVFVSLFLFPPPKSLISLKVLSIWILSDSDVLLKIFFNCRFHVKNA